MGIKSQHTSRGGSVELVGEGRPGTLTIGQGDRVSVAGHPVTVSVDAPIRSVMAVVRALAIEIVVRASCILFSKDVKILN